LNESNGAVVEVVEYRFKVDADVWIGPERGAPAKPLANGEEQQSDSKIGYKP
jgi:hypothetical protein